MFGREEKFDTTQKRSLHGMKKSAQHQNNQPACCASNSNLGHSILNLVFFMPDFMNKMAFEILIK